MKARSRMKYVVNLPEIAVRRGSAALRAGGGQALQNSRAKFDVLSNQRFTRSGQSVFPMRTRMTIGKRAVKYTLSVSRKRMPMWKFDIAPDLSSDTTGRNRKPITFAFRRGQALSLPQGFIWKGMVYRRIGSGGYVTRKDGSHGSGHITLANKLMRETFSAAQGLHEVAPEVLDELVKRVTSGMVEVLT